MKLLHKESLALTVNAVNDLFMFNEKASDAEKKKTAEFIAARQGLQNSYAGTFAPMEKDLTEGAVLYTGEKMKSGAATRHILGEESIRALKKLNVNNKGIAKAFEIANTNMIARLENATSPGYFCCGNCSVSVWRNLLAGGLNNAEARLVSGLKALKKSRDGKGRWGRFHYFYTVSALIEMDLKEAVDELTYSGMSVERSLKRYKSDEIISRRRRFILESALSKI